MVEEPTTKERASVPGISPIRMPERGPIIRKKEQRKKVVQLTEQQKFQQNKIKEEFELAKKKQKQFEERGQRAKAKEWREIARVFGENVGNLNARVVDVRKQAQAAAKKFRRKQARRTTVIKKDPEPTKTILVRDTIKVGGKVIVGFTDKSTGKFIAEGKENKATFEKVKKAFGTEKKADIEKIKKIPEVKKQLEDIKKEARAVEVQISKQQIQKAQQETQRRAEAKKVVKEFDKQLVGFAKVLSPEQKTNILKKATASQFQSQDKQLAEQLPLLTNKDREFLSNLQKPEDLKKVVATLAKARTARWEQEKRLPINLEKKAISDVKKLNPFTKNFTDLQAKEYIKAAMVVSPTIEQNLIKTPQQIVNKKNLLPTPAELMGTKNIIVKAKTEGEKLAVKNAIGAIMKSPKTYVDALDERAKKGEKSPLLNDAKSFGTGVGKGLYAIFGQPVESSFNYGRGLVIRAEQKGTRTVNILKNDVVSAAKTTGSVAKLVAQNPTIAATAVSLAASAGLKQTKDAFKRNPAEATGYALAFLAPGTIIKGALKTTSVTAKVATQVTKATISTKNIAKVTSQVSKLGGAAAKTGKSGLSQLKKVNTKIKDLGTQLKKVNSDLKLGKVSLTQAQAKTKKINTSLGNLVKEKAKVEKVIGEVVKGEKLAKVEKVFKKSDIPKTESGLISFAKKQGTLSKKDAIVVIEKAKKVSPRLQITTTQTATKGVYKLTFKKPKTPSIKVTKTLPKDKKQLVTMLKEAKLQGDGPFNKLKSRITKETGLKVKIFEKPVLDKARNPIKTLKITKSGKVREVNKVKTTIKVLEPKPVKVKVPKQKIKKIKIEPKILNQKQVTKQSKEVAFKLEQGRIGEVNKKVTKSFATKLGKKGSARFRTQTTKSANNWFNKSKKTISSTTRKTKQSVNSYRREINKSRKAYSNNVKQQAQSLNKQKQTVSRNQKAISEWRSRMTKARKSVAAAKTTKLKSSAIKAMNKLRNVGKRLFTRLKQSQIRFNKALNAVLRKLKVLRKQLIKDLNKLRVRLIKGIKKSVSDLKKVRAGIISLKALEANLIKVGLIGRALIPASLIAQTLRDISAVDLDVETIQQPLRDIPQVTDLDIKPIKVIDDKDFKLPKVPKAPPAPRITPPPKITKPVPPKPPVKPRAPPKPVPRQPRKVPLPKFRFGLRPLQPGERYSYTLRFRERGKLKEIKTNLPKNRALAKLAETVDITTVRSMEAVITGITKLKDSEPSKLLRKFKSKKSKTGKVLALVEKSKHAIDTKGEKKGLSASRVLKSKLAPKKKKKVSKSRKTIKKSSKKR